MMTHNIWNTCAHAHEWLAVDICCCLSIIVVIVFERHSMPLQLCTLCNCRNKWIAFTQPSLLHAVVLISSKKLGSKYGDQVKKGGTDGFHETGYVQPRRDWSSLLNSNSRKRPRGRQATLLLCCFMWSPRCAGMCLQPSHYHLSWAWHCVMAGVSRG
jgi:hypothetical protein